MSTLPPEIVPPPTSASLQVRGLWLILFGRVWIGGGLVVIRHGPSVCMFMQEGGWSLCSGMHYQSAGTQHEPRALAATTVSPRDLLQDEWEARKLVGS
jgi:hypothetical protein